MFAYFCQVSGHSPCLFGKSAGAEMLSFHTPFEHFFGAQDITALQHMRWLRPPSLMLWNVVKQQSTILPSPPITQLYHWWVLKIYYIYNVVDPYFGPYPVYI